MVRRDELDIGAFSHSVDQVHRPPAGDQKDRADSLRGNKFKNVIRKPFHIRFQLSPALSKSSETKSDGLAEFSIMPFGKAAAATQLCLPYFDSTVEAQAWSLVREPQPAAYFPQSRLRERLLDQAMPGTPLCCGRRQEPL